MDSQQSDGVNVGDVVVDDEEVKGRMMMEVVFPAFLDAARAHAEEASDAGNRIAALIDVLQHNATELGEAGDGFWSSAVAVCRAVFIEREDALALIERTKALDAREGYSWKPLCVLCYIGASLAPQVIPRLSVNLHMAVAEYIYAHTYHIPALYEQIVMPWFCAYWQRTFDNARYRFIGPRFIEMELQHALGTAPPIRLQQVLQVIAMGLGEPLPERGKAWFNMKMSAGTTTGPLDAIT